MKKHADLEKSLAALKQNAERVKESERYYKGDHDLAFASDKFRSVFAKLFKKFRLNLCPAVCDALRDKLKIKEFRIEEGDQNLAKAAWKLWQDNRMGTRAGEVHKEAVTNGDAYVIVWTDSDGKVTIYPHKAKNCTVFYDEETPGKIVLAAKRWQTADQKTRVNLYYPDRVERFISKAKAAEKGLLGAGAFEYYTDDGEPIIKHDYGIVPVFHFANNANLGENGHSELADAIPIQDAVNKTVVDLLVASEFASFRQRWAVGIEPEIDEDGNPVAPFKSGIDQLWISENPETKFGDFEAADLEKFLKVKADFRVDMACVTGTPLYYFMLTEGTPPSGESLKKAETRFVSKVTDRMESFGQVWEDVIAFALLLESKVNQSARLFTEWYDPAPTSEAEKIDNAIGKKQLGVTDRQLQIELGYGESDIAKMKSEKEAEKAEADKLINAFNAGE